ncbi:MAG: hypothetical protein K2G99_04420 [Desulfovibrio sp.]|nr:hypothetical protein [Desulfovibrio sp.]
MLSGCASMGLENPFSSDPFTGGVDTSTSALLNVPLPAGFQRYASHGYSATTATGGREGLEVLRGNVNAGAAAMELFSALKSHGWQLRLALHKAEHMLEVYEKGGEMAVLTFRSQAVLTILEIWLGQRLPDGATLEMPVESHDEGESGVELAGEEYGPLDEGGSSAPASGANAPAPGTVEQWGVEERSL